MPRQVSKTVTDSDCIPYRYNQAIAIDLIADQFAFRPNGHFLCTNYGGQNTESCIDRPV